MTQADKGSVRLRKARMVAALRAQGLSTTQVAAELRISRSYANTLISDPDGTKDKSRKQKYSGICDICGGPTSGANGRAQAPKRCKDCFPRTPKYWTAERIVAAIQEWAREHNGAPPAASEWLGQVEGSIGQYAKGPRSASGVHRRWPPVTTVQREFGSWANAIEAAGFPKPTVGRYTRSTTTRAKISAVQRKIDYDKLVELHHQGLTASEIAAAIGCSEGTVHGLRAKLGLKSTRRRGGLLNTLFEQLGQ